MVFRAKNSKGWTKIGQNATWCSGVFLKRGGQKNAKCNMGFDSDTFKKNAQNRRKIEVGQKLR